VPAVPCVNRCHINIQLLSQLACLVPCITYPRLSLTLPHTMPTLPHRSDLATLRLVQHNCTAVVPQVEVDQAYWYSQAGGGGGGATGAGAGRALPMQPAGPSHPAKTVQVQVSVLT
jgi:hypothetical protein